MKARPVKHVKDRLCDRGECAECNVEAPLKIMLEAWPLQARARASLTENGKTRDIEISSLVLSMILGAVRNAR